MLAVPAFITPAAAAFVLNLVLFATITSLVAWIVYAHTGHRFAALLAGGAMITSPVMLYVHSYAFSEPLFILFVLISLVLLQRYQRSQNYKHWLGAALAASCAALTRYIGVSVLFSGALVILLSAKGTWRRRLVIAFSYALVAAGPLAFWLVRNLSLTGALTGVRSRSHYGVAAMAVDFTRTLMDWFVPTILPLVVRVPFALLVIAAMLYLFHNRRKFKTIPTYESLLSSPYAAFIVSYTSCQLAASLIVALAPIGGRFLAPLFPVWVIIFLTRLLPNPASCSDTRINSSCLPALAIAIGILIISPSINTFREIAYAKIRTDGAGYMSAKWRQADIVQAVQDNIAPFSKDTIIFSNAADVLFLYAGRGTRYLPRIGQECDRELIDFHRALQSGKNLVVFVHRNDTLSRLLQESALQRSPLFRSVAQFKDGAVYVPVELLQR
jgi:4-amino-4-deoxy-L-arabinose transferase-like glycosyltransferase